MKRQYGKFKVLKYASRISDLQKGKPFGPVTAEVHLTNACDLKCWWCSDKVRREANRASSLDMDVVRSLLADFKSLGGESIVWEGGGEPTVSPDFAPALREASRLGLRSGVITNGYGLMDPDKRSAIAECADWCRVSVDAGSPLTYAKDHGCDHGRFAAVMDGIKVLRESNSSMVIGYSFIVSESNVDEIVTAAHIAKSIGCSYVHFKAMIHDQDSYDVLDRDFPSSIGHIEESKVMESDSFSVYTSRTDKDHNKRSFSACRSHNFVAHVAANGLVYVCCALAMQEGADGFKQVHDDIVFGSLHENTFLEIWLGENRRRICKLFEDESVVARCPSCRFVEHNEVLDSALADYSPFL